MGIAPVLGCVCARGRELEQTTQNSVSVWFLNPGRESRRPCPPAQWGQVFGWPDAYCPKRHIRLCYGGFGQRLPPATHRPSR